MTDFRKSDRPTTPLPVPTDWAKKVNRPQTKKETTGKLPLDLARYFDGSSADIFIADDPSPRLGENNYEAESRPLLSKGMQVADSPQARPAHDRQQSAVMKTMEISHLEHMNQIPMQKVISPSQSLLFQMKGEGGQNQAALYAQMAAQLALAEKKKKKKKKRLVAWIKDFLKSLFG